MTRTSFPFEPVTKLWPQYFTSWEHEENRPENAPSMLTLAEAIGVHLRTVEEWYYGRKSPSPESADKIAIGLGVHPSAIWPDEWDQYLHESLYRVCRVCKEEKPLEHCYFSERKGKELSYRYDCRQCEKAATAARRAEKKHEDVH